VTINAAHAYRADDIIASGLRFEKGRVMKELALLSAAVCISTQLIAPSLVLADSEKNKFGWTEKELLQLRNLANRDDYRAAAALKKAKQFAKEEKYDEADKAFKQAEELMLGYKGDQFFLKIIYQAQIYYLNKHNRTTESEALEAKLNAAALRIPHSPIYEGNAFGHIFQQELKVDAKCSPTLPDGPPIPDDQ